MVQKQLVSVLVILSVGVYWKRASWLHTSSKAHDLAIGIVNTKSENIQACVTLYVRLQCQVMPNHLIGLSTYSRVLRLPHVTCECIQMHHFWGHPPPCVRTTTFSAMWTRNVTVVVFEPRCARHRKRWKSILVVHIMHRCCCMSRLSNSENSERCHLWQHHIFPS